MSAVDDFLSITAKEREENKKTAVDDFLSIKPKSATEDFLSIVPKENVPRETGGVKKTILSPEAQTAVGKVLAKGLDIWNTSLKSLETEGEKLVLKSVDKAIETQDYLGNIQKKIAGLDFMKVLMTPMGQYYASLGTKIPTPSMIVEKVAPKVFELPEDWETQYPPWVSAFIKSVNGEPNAAISKFSQMVFLDSLSFGGMNKIVEKIMPAITAIDSTAEVKTAVGQTLADLNKMTPEGLALYNRELAMAKRESEIPMYVDPPQPIESNTAIIAGVKYSTINGQPIKTAQKVDELIARKMSSLENEAPHTAIPKDLSFDEIMPPPGEVEIKWTPMMRVKQMASWILSPHNYARPVFDQIALHKRMMEDLGRTGQAFVEKYFGRFNEKQLNALGAVKDKIKGHEVVLNNWGEIFGEKSDEAIKALDAYRAGWNYWKETLGLTEEQAIKDYLPHIIKYYQNRNLPVPAELNLAVKNPKRFLRERIGAPDYMLNIEDLYKIYNGWAARYVATEKFKIPIAEAIASIQKLNPEYAAMARDYSLNYFGEFRKASETYNRMMKVSGTVGKTLSDGLIANNYASALANVTQGPYFGFSALGHHWIKGVRLAAKASFESNSEALRWQKIWMNSGLEESGNTLYYKEASSLTDLLIQKTLGHKAMQQIDEISYAGMWMTEVLNKKPMYLGAYNKAEKIANKVLREPGKHKVLEQWLQQNGIDITKNLDTELFKHAHYETVKAMQDYSRAGQNALNMDPITGLLMRVANFPLRAGETVATNAFKAAGYIKKGFSSSDPMLLRTALMMPETGSTLRFGVLTTLGYLLADKMGLNADKVIGITNFVVSSSPVVGVANQIMKGYTAWEEKDPRWVKKNLKSLAMIMGFKLTAPAFQLARFLEAAEANKNNHSGKWTIYSGDPKSPHSDIIDQVDPVWFAFSILSPIQFNTMDDYRKWIKENASKQRKINNLQKQIEIEDYNYNSQKAAEVQARKDKFKEDQEKEKAEFLQKHPQVELR